MIRRQLAPLVYLASRYSRREELQGYAGELARLGIGRVDAKWLHEQHDWDGADVATAQALALDDVRDLERAHAVVVFTEEAGEYRRGGSLVELGLAIGTGKHVVIVGPAPNVFCTLPSIPRFDTWQGALAYLVAWKDAVEQVSLRQRLLS